MKVVITGGGGFIGLRLARALLTRGTLASGGSQQPIARIALLDTAFPPNLPSDARLEVVTADVADPAVIERVVTPDTASIFHLAAVVSGGAEADFDLGMRVNLEAMRLLLERARRTARPPRVVFASSVAAFGRDLPAVLDDSITPNPQTSYGMQKVVSEYLLSDYSRKGFMDGRSLRLPTIVVRPGKPNLAASSFASAIIREPLNGIDYECPVDADTGIWMLSPRRVVEAFMHAHDLPAAAWGTRPVVNLPGITASIRAALEALARLAGEEVSKRVLWKPDARIQAIVKTWPVNFNTPRALAMGFSADPDVETIVRSYIADEGIKV